MVLLESICKWPVIPVIPMSKIYFVPEWLNFILRQRWCCWEVTNLLHWSTIRYKFCLHLSTSNKLLSLTLNSCQAGQEITKVSRCITIAAGLESNCMLWVWRWLVSLKTNHWCVSHSFPSAPVWAVPGVVDCLAPQESLLWAVAQHFLHLPLASDLAEVGDGSSVSRADVSSGANLESMEVALEALLTDVGGQGSIPLTFPLSGSLNPLNSVEGDGEFHQVDFERTGGGCVKHIFAIQMQKCKQNAYVLDMLHRALLNLMWLVNGGFFNISFFTFCNVSSAFLTKCSLIIQMF